MPHSEQSSQFLKQVENHHPQAFRRNFLLYGMIKTHGLMDELKEIVPWVLALMIFVSLSLSLGHFIEQQLPQFSAAQAQGIAILAFMLLYMLYVPVVLKQIKHTSISFYEQQQNAPFKLTILILIQGLNIAFLESLFVQIVLFFLAMSFGFVRFYKENLFREEAGNEQYFQIQDTRRACFWAYKQVQFCRLRLLFCTKNSDKAALLQKRQSYFQSLHEKLFQHENLLCKKYKHTNLDSYLDSLM